MKIRVSTPAVFAISWARAGFSRCRASGRADVFVGLSAGEATTSAQIAHTSGAARGARAVIAVTAIDVPDSGADEERNSCRIAAVAAANVGHSQRQRWSAPAR